VPLMAAPAECGFPLPADDYLDRPLDFNELLIENPAATFAVRIAGESMTGAGLFKVRWACRCRPYYREQTLGQASSV
jgi:SOS-response transcriptional repressor LexA